MSVQYSDHGAIFITTEEIRRFFKRQYKFEAMWLTVDECEEIIRTTWNQNFTGSPHFILVQKLKASREALRVWNKNVFGNIFHRKQMLQEQRKGIQDNMETI